MKTLVVMLVANMMMLRLFNDHSGEMDDFVGGFDGDG